MEAETKMKKEIRKRIKNADIIDSHAHLSVNKGSRAKIEKLEQSMTENEIDFAIVLAAYFPRKTGSITNKQIISIAEDYDNLIVFGSLDAENNLQKGIRELEELLIKDKIAGIKLYPGYQFIYPNDEKFDELYKLALKFNVPVMFHSGLTYRSPGAMKYSRPIYIDDVSSRFPEMKIIISHLGDPYTREATAIAHRNHNVYLDFSGLISNTTKSLQRDEKWRLMNREYMAETISNVFIDLMGTEKIIFATDWPISSHKSYILLVDFLEKRLALNKEERKQILSKNILKVLGII